MNRREFLRVGAGIFLRASSDRLFPQNILSHEPLKKENLIFYFPETGHHLSGPFLDFWRRKGGKFIFGEPLTEVIRESGMPVQYCQKARLELHPDRQIRLGLLGSEIFPNRFSPEEGISLPPKFSIFYRTRGGLEIFGYPLSPAFEEEGRLVQYFERAKFSYHPEALEPFYKEQERLNKITLLSLNEVQLAPLGEVVCRKKSLPLLPVAPQTGSLDYNLFTPAKKIVVDLTKQELTAFEGEIPVIVADISSGRPTAPTPKGQFRILHRIPLQSYRGSTEYGVPYYYPHVPFNLHFYDEYFLHGVYWHDKFGKTKGFGASRGCVNLDLGFAEQVYHWAEDGTPVVVGSF